MVAIILPRAEVSVGRVEEVLATVPEIASPKECLSPAQTAPKGELAFEHVSFHYPAAKGNVIEDVSFSVRPGELTAIVGPTGSGKSTLLQLIPRLYDPTSGKITLDGIELDKMSLADVRSRIGYVPQQAFLFSGTIDSNVAFGSTKVSRQEVLEAINVAQAHEIVEQRKGGLDAEISQGGANVSGGQRQRLAIARALAIEPEVLVLDDSFSALDYTTDAHLRQALSRNRSKIAILVVAQRIATVMDASQIIVLDEGRVVGKGTHSELLSSCPEYLEMAKSQLSESELGLDEVK
jgi:ATP-binding cassette subfamily B protein